MVKMYQDIKNGRVFEMNPQAFEKFMSRKKLPDGRAQYVEYDGKKKHSQKAEVPPPPPTKSERVAEVLNEELQSMTAKQLVQHIETMTDPSQLQVLSEDKRTTVARAAQSRLAAVAEGGEA